MKYLTYVMFCVIIYNTNFNFLLEMTESSNSLFEDQTIDVADVETSDRLNSIKKEILGNSPSSKEVKVSIQKLATEKQRTIEKQFSSTESYNNLRGDLLVQEDTNGLQYHYTLASYGIKTQFKYVPVASTGADGSKAKLVVYLGEWEKEYFECLIDSLEHERVIMGFLWALNSINKVITLNKDYQKLKTISKKDKPWSSSDLTEYNRIKGSDFTIPQVSTNFHGLTEIAHLFGLDTVVKKYLNDRWDIIKNMY